MSDQIVRPADLLRGRNALSMQAIQKRAVELAKSDTPEARAVRQFFVSAGITAATLGHFRVVLTQPTATFPFVGYGVPYLDGIEVNAVRVHNLGVGSEHSMRLIGSASRPLNYDVVRGAQHVVVVDSELDAMSLHQVGIKAVTVAGPAFSEGLRAATRTAESVTLWAPHMAERTLVELFGSRRVRIVRVENLPPAELENARSTCAWRNGQHVTANDCLNGGVAPDTIRALVEGAKGVGHAGVVGVGEFANDLLDLLQGDTSLTLGAETGIRSLDTIMRGIRDEFIAVTGHTGDGKSTLMHYLLEQQAVRNGTPILVGSFENGPLAVAIDQFQRHNGSPIHEVKTDEQRARAVGMVGQMGAWPIHLINHKGRIGMRELVDHLHYARDTLGVRHALIDHLRFITPRDRGRDQFEAQSQTLLEFSELPKQLGMSIILIAHPKHGVERDTVPTGDNIHGGGDMKQLCDTGLSVWRDPEGRAGSTRKVRLRDALGAKREMDLAGNETLVTVWKSRNKQAGRGSTVLQFNARSLTFEDRPIPVDSSAPAENEDTAPPLFDVETYV